jgi:hypothetical protein
MMLHQANIEIGFNPNNLREVDDAKKKYIDARRDNRVITDLEGNRIENFRPALGGFIIREQALGDNEFAFRIFDDTGDRRVIWNCNDPAEIREAKNEFDKYISKGWKAYAINRNGSMGKRIRSFDADLQEIVFDDKEGLTAKLKDFAKSFKEVKVVPRTYPG